MSCRTRCRTPHRSPSLPPNGALELALVHLRAALDVLVLRLLIELVEGPPAGALVRAQPAAPAGGDVLRGGPGGGARLSGPRPLLVHGASRDLLGGVLGAAALLQPLLDVLVLAVPLAALLDPARRHLRLLRLGCLLSTSLSRVANGETSPSGDRAF